MNRGNCVGPKGEVVSSGAKPKPVVIERRSGKLFQASRPVRFKIVIILVVAALALGAFLALGLKQVVVLDSRLGDGTTSVAANGRDPTGRGMNA